jgi:signal peptidase I
MLLVSNAFGQIVRSHCSARKPVLYLALGLCFIAFALFQWVFWPVVISGDSMVPSYHDGQPTYINKLAYLTHEPQRGDVVGVRVGGDFYLKRIIGVPGDRILFQRGTVIVNGTPLVEPYVERPLLWWLRPVEVGPSDYFVMGDNRTSSALGTIAKRSIVGKAVF